MSSERRWLRVTLGTLAGISLLGLVVAMIWLAGASPAARSALAQPDLTPQLTVIPGDTAAQQGLAVGDQRRIVVSGEGIVSAQPDTLNLQLGVEVQNQQLQPALDQAALAATQIISDLLQSGVAEADITTASYNIEPVMDNQQNGQPTVTGFRVTHIFAVTLHNIDAAGTVIDKVVGSGANRVYGISFSFADPNALLTQARERAMSDARSKATQLAASGGVTLGPPLVIEEQSGTVVPVSNASSTAAGSAATPPISAGQQNVRVQVTVQYAIQ